MKKILLHGAHGEKFATVDDDDFALVEPFKWYYLRADQVEEKWYAYRHNEVWTPVYMHRAIMCAPVGIDVDHRDGDGLYNVRSNLRLATRSQNNANRETVGSASGFRGVYPHRNKFCARIWAQGRSFGLGTYASAEDAARAYDKAAIEHFGEFARPNFPDWRAA